MKFDPKKTIFLIDGSSFLYRAYFGLRPLHTPDGEPVQAVYSFCRMIKKLIDKFQPKYIALVWDSKGKTTRHEVFAEYKATRQAPPSDIFDQKEYILEFADLIGLKQIGKERIEADDLMFTIAQERKKEGDDVVLVTSDKDMGQALDEHVFMFDAFKDLVIDVAAFEAKMGFPPSHLPLYFGLVGDTSDNIPGVAGIGQKGATEIAKKFATMEELYQNLDTLKPGKTLTSLIEQKDKAFLSRDLFLLQDHPTHLSKEDLSFDQSNWINAQPLFEELNFQSLLKDMGVGEKTIEQKTVELEKYDFRAITSQLELASLVASLEKAGAFALDTETMGLNPLQDPVIGISVAYKEGSAYYIPFGHQGPGAEKQLSRQTVLGMLKPILENRSIKKYLHNAKFDKEVLQTAGIDVKGITFDTMIAANLLSEGWERVGLKFLSMHYFKEAMLSFEEMVKSQKLKNFSFVPLDRAALYASHDAHQTLKLQQLLAKDFENKKELASVFYDVEMPLMELLDEMETYGIYLDVSVLQDLDKKVTRRMAEIEDAIIESVGDQFADINLNSPKQVEQLLFHHLQLPVQKKSAKGSYSTDAEVLSALSIYHPVPGLILQYRELSKLKGTYIDALPEYINPATGRIHTNFSQTQVATGRLASSDPNLQNVPADSGGYGIEIRAAFKPAPGNVFLSADYSQIELRVLAYLSGDERLTQAFLKGLDIHAQTAAGLFDVPLEQVTNEQRQVGKRINFSILYGMTSFGLSKDLKISFGQAKEYIDKYFSQYPGVQKWMDETVEFTLKHGYVQTVWGRRRYVPAIYEKNRPLFEEAKRIAINTVAQGTAAEIMKIGMLRLHEALRAKNLGAKILLQIHDELVLEVPQAEQQQTQELVKHVLESVVKWPVPLEVSTSVGANWKEIT